MGFIRKEEIRVGDNAILIRAVKTYDGYFEEGTKVKVTEVENCNRNGFGGYSAVDEHGNKLYAVPWDALVKA